MINEIYQAKQNISFLDEASLYRIAHAVGSFIVVYGAFKLGQLYQKFKDKRKAKKSLEENLVNEEKY